MSDGHYRVHIVVDSKYGERLREFPVDEPVWVVDSECNHPVIQALWREREGARGHGGLTSFKYDPRTGPEDWLISHLSVIDLHHGEFSHDPPWSILNVVGVEWSDAIREEFAMFGVDQFETTEDGFVAMRTPGKA